MARSTAFVGYSKFSGTGRGSRQALSPQTSWLLTVLNPHLPQSPPSASELVELRFLDSFPGLLWGLQMGPRNLPLRLGIMASNARITGP